MDDKTRTASTRRAQLLQPLRYGRNSTGNQCSQLLDFSFQLPQQRIVCLDLAVQFAAVRDDSLALQRLRCHAFMDGGNLIQPPCGVAAVVNAFLPPGTFQTAVGHVSPRCPPCRKLFLAVPTFGDGILPAIAPSPTLYLHCHHFSSFAISFSFL